MGVNKTDSGWVEERLLKEKHEADASAVVEKYVRDSGVPDIPNLPEWLSAGQVLKMIATKLYGRKYDSYIKRTGDESTFLPDEFQKNLAHEASRYHTGNNQDLLADLIDL